MNDYSLFMNMTPNNNTAKLLSFLLRDAELHNINQMSRILDLSVGSVHKILKILEERDIVNVKELGNALYYSLNLKNNETRKSCELMLIEEKNYLLKRNKTAKVYIQDLEKYDAKCTVLFGSILSKGEQAKDIDVLFVIKKKEQIAEVNKLCLEISRIRTKKINPLVMLEQDLIKNLKTRNKAIINIIKEGIVLKGEDLFVSIMKNAR